MTLIPWVLPGIFLELAILMFQWFRRVRRTKLFLIIPALMGCFSLLMFLLVVATYTANGPLQIEPDDQLLFVGVFTVLLVLILVVPHIKLGYAPNALGDAARARDRRDPPRKRPLIVDVLGCAGLGLLLTVALGLLVAFGSSLGH